MSTRSASRGRKTPSTGRSASKPRTSGRSPSPQTKASPAKVSPSVAAGGLPAHGNYTLTAGDAKQFPVIVPGADIKLPAIQRLIPAHYFKQNTLRGFSYVARDLLQVAATAYVMYNYGLPLIDDGAAFLAGFFGAGAVETNVFAALLKFAVWNLYWYVQGLNFTGLWVLAHECGHQAFSPYRVVNDTVGFLLHSALLVPYHSWRISHGNHHKHTNHCDLDTVFVPIKLDNPAAANAFRESPVVSLFFMIVTFTVGWPAYLIANATGQTYSRRTNHFEPNSPLFRKEDAADIVVSDLGIIATIAAIAYVSSTFSFLNVVCWYGIPYLWTNFWLVFITYLQHSDIRLPHYNAAEWNFVRGALAAVDRNFGRPLNWWLHHINDSHIMHHLFSTMPFYNAIEVTRKYNKQIFGELYHTDDRPLTTMLWESWNECRYVVPNEGVAIFRH